MIMLRILDFVQSDLNVLVQLDDYKKRAFYVFVTIMSSRLISRSMRFSFSIADNSCFVDYFFFDFFRSLQNHCIILAIDVLINKAHKIFQVDKLRSSEEDARFMIDVDRDENVRMTTRWEWWWKFFICELDKHRCLLESRQAMK
jgi:hypothetical protein